MTNHRNKRHLPPRPAVEDVLATIDTAWRDALTQRPPLEWCTYPNGAGEILGQIRGPNTLGEYLVAVRVEEPAEDGSQRVGWSYAVVDDFRRLGVRPPRREYLRGTEPRTAPRLSNMPALALIPAISRSHS